MSEIVMGIISNVTGFMTYFVPGYLLVSCFTYAACIERESKTEYLVIKSIAISFILYILISYIGEKCKFGDSLLLILTFTVAILFGLLFGRLYRSWWLSSISLFLFNREIKQQLFVELWESADTSESALFVRLLMKNNLGIYEGQISKVLSYNSDPEFSLQYYKCYDTDMHIISDCSQRDEVYLIVRYSDVEKFEYELVPLDE